MKANVKTFLLVLKKTFNGFFENKILKMSASLSYTTVFSIAPLLLVIIYVSDIFWGREAIEGTIYSQFKNFIGSSGAEQLQQMIRNIAISNEANFAGVIGIITLLIGATSVFAEIQDSLNTIWGIKPKTQSGFWLYLKSRLLSFGVIGSIGFILLVSLGISAIMDALSDKLLLNFSDISYYIVYFGNVFLTFIIISLLFGAIFTILPDAEIKWRQVRLASFTTAILFMIGKFLISYYILNSNIGSVYGTAGSLVILMVWVYYSSVILYFGAQFAKCYALEYSTPIIPSEYAEVVHTIEIKSNNCTLQSADKEFDKIKDSTK